MFDQTGQCPATYLSQEQLARRWGISSRSLERWRTRGCGPAFLKIGGQVRYRQDDIEAYERAQRRGRHI